jgi:catechol 2,3-dioxygenase-like lactoylglutathione lyase family enzyme
MTIEPRISLITLGVSDLERSYKFYKDGLGLPTTRSPTDGIIFFQMRGTCLALFPYEELAADVGDSFKVAKSRFPGITIAYNVREKSEVAAVLQLAESAGAKIEKPAHDTFWGGHSGYFSDPDGYLWEVAYGAFEFNADGSLKVT